MWVFEKVQNEYRVGFVLGDTVRFVLNAIDRGEAMRIVNYLNGGKGV